MPRMTTEQVQGLGEKELEQKEEEHKQKREEQGQELTVWEKKERSEKRKEQRLNKEISDSTDIFHHPKGGYKCVSSAHEEGDEPKADFLFKHGGVFGGTENFPPLVPLCEYCARLVKMLPFDSEKKAGAKVGLKKLARLANQLDQRGLYKEAALIDQILKEAK